MIKLLTRLEDELVKEQAKLEKTDEKKKNYKQLARGLNVEFQMQLTAERQEFEAQRLPMVSLIEEQDTEIKKLLANQENQQTKFN